MADIAPLSGVLVGLERRPYGSFTDQATGQVVAGGETLWVYLAPADGAGAPVGVKVKPDQYDSLQGAGFLAWAELTVELRARNNKVVRSLQSIDDLGHSEVGASLGRPAE